MVGAAAAVVKGAFGQEFRAHLSLFAYGFRGDSLSLLRKTNFLGPPSTNQQQIYTLGPPLIRDVL